ncbi:hypothetical protein DB347_21105 [Opitutaceae bacterium EW11]|nr:hypothetical protein DB347_21105 [Opitutaceae bacterium EW11]
MNYDLTRRAFLRRSAFAASLAIVGRSQALRSLSAAEPPSLGDVVSVQGADRIAATRKGLELAGFASVVKQGAKVGLLINAPRWWTKPGSYTSPEIVLAVLDACLAQGASEITTVMNPAGDYFDRTRRSADFKTQIQAVRRNRGDWREVEIPKGKALKNARMNTSFFDCDVLINLPIAKHHAGTGFSGALKNVMGACHSSTNRFFHNGSGASSDYDDVEFLSQCIADVNLVRKPDLIVCDATEFLLTNGPAGPGELAHANKVLVGRNPVAVDAHGCTLVGRKPEEVGMIVKAAAHGIGRMEDGLRPREVVL